MAAFQKLREEYRDLREREKAKNPLRIRQLSRELWPWYLPLWIFPAVFVSASFLGLMPRGELITRGLLPGIVCFLIFLLPTMKKDMSWRETIFFYKLVPICTLVSSAVIWSWIHDTYMK